MTEISLIVTLNNQFNSTQDVYTILNRIQLIIWTICGFRVLNPHQWSFANESSSKFKSDAQKVPNQGETKRDGVINPQNYNFDFYA